MNSAPAPAKSRSYAPPVMDIPPHFEGLTIVQNFRITVLGGPRGVPGAGLTALASIAQSNSVAEYASLTEEELRAIDETGFCGREALRLCRTLPIPEHEAKLICGSSTFVNGVQYMVDWAMGLSLAPSTLFRAIKLFFLMRRACLFGMMMFPIEQDGSGARGADVRHKMIATMLVVILATADSHYEVGRAQQVEVKKRTFIKYASRAHDGLCGTLPLCAVASIITSIFRNQPLGEAIVTDDDEHIASFLLRSMRSALLQVTGYMCADALPMTVLSDNFMEHGMWDPVSDLVHAHPMLRDLEAKTVSQTGQWHKSRSALEKHVNKMEYVLSEIIVFRAVGKSKELAKLVRRSRANMIAYLTEAMFELSECRAKFIVRQPSDLVCAPPSRGCASVAIPYSVFCGSVLPAKTPQASGVHDPLEDAEMVDAAEN